MGTGRPPSDRAVGGKIEADARAPVTHMFLLPKEPSEGHKSQDLRSRGSISRSRLIFLLGSCVLRRLQVETRRVQRVGGSESLSLDRTRCLSPGLLIKVRQEVQSLLFLRGLGVWLSPESPEREMVLCSGGHADPAYRPCSRL